MISGAPAAAKTSFADASRLAETTGKRSREQRVAVAQRFAADPKIATQFYVALTLWSLGEVGQSRRFVTEALAEAHAMKHAHTLGHALAHAAIYAVISRETPWALALSKEAVEYARTHDLAMFTGYGEILLAFALAMSGDAAGSIAKMESGFTYMARTQTGAMVPMHRALHARTLATLGRFDEAERHAEAARAEMRSGSERFFWPESERLLGDYLSLSPDARQADVEAAYARALALAREQQAKSWELYAALSLARHWVGQGERRKAVAFLAPVHAGFVDGRDLQAFKDASALLEELG
jgi:predicted ATPase